MGLEKASARLAPRSPWQAVDLGTKLYRQWAAPVLWVWLAFTLVPFGLMLGWSLLAETLWPLFLFWWLKPLWERPVLAWYSHALFAETLTLKQLFQRWRQYALPGLASQLTWRRFSPARSFNTCVWQLEGAKGEQLSQRLRALNSYPSNRAGIMTIVVLHLEQFMAMGLMVLLYTLVPWQFSLEWSDWFYDQGALQMAIACATLYLVMCVTEPLYVACGFALYLNKRTWLEGWDLQLGLTRLGRHRASRTGATLLMLLALLLPLPEPVTAQPSPRNNEEQQQVIELLAGPDYMPFEERTERQWKDRDDDSDSWLEKFWKHFFDNLDDDEQQEPSDSPFDIPDAVLWILFWGVFAGLAIWLLIKVMDQLGLGSRNRDSTPVIPTHVAGMDIRRQSLPKNLRDATEQALGANDIRLALSLMLRSALAELLRRYPVSLAAGSTEQQCLRNLQAAHGEPLPILYLQRLIQAWISTAWAHRPVDAETVRTLLADWEHISAEEAANA